MYHMSLARLTAFVSDIEFEKTAEFAREVESPDIIFSRQQTVEHDITDRRIGVAIILEYHSA